MGDFALDTEVEGGEGLYQAKLSADWRIWGPNGGYVAAIALRAAGRESRLARPATFSCQFLDVGAFAPAQARVQARRRGRSVEAFGVSLEQDGKHLLEAQVWTVGALEGLAHDVSRAPEVPSPEALPDFAPVIAPGDPPSHPFWQNLDRRPLDQQPPAQQRAGAPTTRAWLRFRPRARFDDPYVDAARSLLLLDTFSWPAVRALYTEQPAVIAPSLDLSVQFHAFDPASEWLLVETSAEVARDGLIGFRSRVWSQQRLLLASGGGQLVCRPAPTGIRR